MCRIAITFAPIFLFLVAFSFNIINNIIALAGQVTGIRKKKVFFIHSSPRVASVNFSQNQIQNNHLMNFLILLFSFFAAG